MSYTAKSLEIHGKKLKFRGYSFNEDDISNKMAYLFAGEEGQTRAKKIREEAEKIEDLKLRKEFIEQELSNKAKAMDENFQQGISDIVAKLPTSGKDMSGKDAGKDIAVSLMKNLGLNVDPDNVQTHYSPGPPMCFQISWVNRPAPELKEENSEINKLSACYADSLSPTEKEDFNAKWETHVTNAKNGGPKIDKTTFELDSATSWRKFKDEVKQEYKQSPQMTPTADTLNSESTQFKR